MGSCGEPWGAVGSRGKPWGVVGSCGEMCDEFLMVLLFFEDDDECAVGAHRCVQVCQNTVGSHTCSCLDGYLLQDDGFSCMGKICSVNI